MTRRYNASFIKNVMEQVKKEVDHDPKMKKAWEEFAAKKQSAEGKFQGIKSFTGLKSSSIDKIKNSEVLDKSLNAVKDTWTRVSSAAQPIVSKLGHSVPSREAFAKLDPAINKVKSVGGSVAAKVSKLSTQLGLSSLEERKLNSYAKWRANRDATVRAAKPTEEGKPVEASSPVDAIPIEVGDGLVVSDRGNSSWDRFGANMKDMPFLNAFFSNPLLDSLFGETEISASIRQMREDVNPDFSLAEFIEEIENIVTPNFIKWYLEGDSKKLKHHCGEAAFGAVNASITAREKQKLYLDTSILSGPSDFELKAAKSGSAGESAAGTASPLFVFTFNAQQINCLRDAEGNVVEGAVDDIRQLYYAIAVQRSPKENSAELDFPWQIQEVAILGNQPCW